MDLRGHNRRAWDRSVEDANRWTQPVAAEVIEKARRGEFEIVLTPSRPVPRHWFPSLQGKKTLCLAAAGGQQGPVLAAAGAAVTVLDNSPKQLAQDRRVAEQHGLQIKTLEGDMADLSALADASFELIFHPCSNAFVPDVIPVWRECFRVLRPGGLLLAGFTNPVRYLFDDLGEENSNLEVRYSIPYSDLRDLAPARLRTLVEDEQPLEFGHTLTDQIGGQLEAGFVLTGFYEDQYAEEDGDRLSQFLPTFIATRSAKP